MAKQLKPSYACQQCGTVYPKWQGQCYACKEWNTIAEELPKGNPKSVGGAVSLLSHGEQVIPLTLSSIKAGDEERLDLYDPEFNRVLGGGLVRGAFILLAGDPGIGKSTLVLQTVLRSPYKTLYVSGEESASQLKMRADRLGNIRDNCLIFTETNIETIIRTALDIKPELLIIDSIQTIHTELSDSSPGSIVQIRECANILLKYGKSQAIPVLLIGHINKEGSIAGPKILEHTVDVVLQFEGDKHYMYRMLRGQKNRFGSTHELGIYEMQSSGLRPVENPSEHLIGNRQRGLSGVAIAVAMEGARSFLIETQALVSSAVYATPQRSSTGYDTRRMNMLLAVLEKRAGFKLIQKDVFLNIAGGIKVADPAIDLAVITAVLSSSLDLSLPEGVCLAGEVGLSGEVRPISRIEQRVLEAKRIGFKHIVVPRANVAVLEQRSLGINIIGVDTVEEAFRTLFASNRS